MMVPMLALGVSVLSGDVANAQAISGGIGGGAASAKGDGTAETLFGDGGIFKTGDEHLALHHRCSLSHHAHHRWHPLRCIGW